MEWCTKAMSYSLYALAYFLPISAALMEIFFTIALLLFFIKRGIVFYTSLKGLSPDHTLRDKVKLFLYSYKPKTTYLNWPIGVFIFAGFFSILVSRYPLLSIQGFIFKLLEWTYLYFMMIECILEKRQLKILMSIFIVSAALVTLSGFLQRLTGIDFIRGHPLVTFRVTSSFRHANDFGAYLVVVSLISLVYALNGFHLRVPGKKEDSLFYGRLIKTFMVCLFILALVCLGLTYSRGAWVAFFIGLIFLSLLKPKHLPVLICVILSFFLIFFHRMELNRSLSMLTHHFVRHESTSTEPPSREPQNHSAIQEKSISSDSGGIVHDFEQNDRVVLWQIAIQLIKQHPFGIGLNTYSQVSNDYSFSHRGFPFWGGYPHNCYLHLTVETGIFGLLSFVWIVFVLFRNSTRHVHMVRDKFLASTLLGSLTGLSAFLAHSFVDTNFYSTQLGDLLWLMIGVVVISQKIALDI